VIIITEKAVLKKNVKKPAKPEQRILFPTLHEAPDTIITSKGLVGTKVVINKVAGGNDNFYSEVYKESGKGWAPSFKLGPVNLRLAICRKMNLNFLFPVG